MDVRKNMAWDDGCPWPSKPKFYEKPDGSIFGAVPLIEGVKTALPKDPKSKYQVDQKPVTQWKLVFISTSKDQVLHAFDYAEGLAKIRSKVLEEQGDMILVKGLSLAEMEQLI